MPAKNAPTVLVAEDDRFLLKAYEAKLEKSGFKVVLAKDGEETLFQLKSARPDILLLDLVMPKMNGFEVLEEMQADPALKKIPVVILTNLGQEADVKRGMELGAESYLVKSDHSLQQIVDVVTSKVK